MSAPDPEDILVAQQAADAYDLARAAEDDCGREGCNGFSCLACGLCTSECPNMRCTRAAPPAGEPS